MPSEGRVRVPLRQPVLDPEETRKGPGGAAAPGVPGAGTGQGWGRHGVERTLWPPFLAPSVPFLGSPLPWTNQPSSLQVRQPP